APPPPPSFPTRRSSDLIALDPSFVTNHFVYVCASRDDNGWLNQVLRYRESNSSLAFDGYVIRTGMFAGGNHDGCRVRFGPDGKRSEEHTSELQSRFDLV